MKKTRANQKVRSKREQILLYIYLVFLVFGLMFQVFLLVYHFLSCIYSSLNLPISILIPFETKLFNRICDIVFVLMLWVTLFINPYIKRYFNLFDAVRTYITDNQIFKKKRKYIYDPIIILVFEILFVLITFPKVSEFVLKANTPSMF